MDKFEYNAKLGEITRLAEQEEYEEAAKIADTIEWKRVRNVRTLCMISEIYEASGQLDGSKQILLRAYRRSPMVRSILYRLTEVSIKMREFDEAVEYYTEFVNAVPNDNTKYILKYKLYRGRGSSLEEQIGILEEYKHKEYTEQWAYELAKLYHRAGLIEQCVEECDDIALWFHNGKYVVKALELKRKYAPLTMEQQTVYDNPSGIVDLKTKEETVTKAVPKLEKEILRGMPETREEAMAANIIAATEKEIAASVAKHKREKEKNLAARIHQDADFSQFAQSGDEEKYAGEQKKESIPVYPAYNTADLQMELAKNMREILSGIKKPNEDVDVEPATVVDGTMQDDAINTARVSKDTEEQRKVESDFPDIDEVLTAMSREEESSDGEEASNKEPLGEKVPEEVESEDEVLGEEASEEDELSNGGAALYDGEEASDSERTLCGDDESIDEDELSDEAEEFYDEEEVTEEGREACDSYDGMGIVDAGEVLDDEGTVDAGEVLDDDGTVDVGEVLDDDGTVDAGEVLDDERTVDAGEVLDDDGTVDAGEVLDDEGTVDAGEVLDDDGTVDAGETSDGEEALDDEEALDPDEVVDNEDLLKGYRVGEHGTPVKERVSDALTGDTIDLSAAIEAAANTAHLRAKPKEEKAPVQAVHKETDPMYHPAPELRARIPKILTPVQKKTLGFYAYIKGLDAQLANAIEKIKEENVGSQTSRSGNVVVTGDPGSGRTVLGINLAKVVSQEKHQESARVAKIYAEDFNKKDIPATINKIAGGTLIIEEAGDLDENAVEMLAKSMDFKTEGLLVILEDEKSYVRDLLARYPDLAAKFNVNITIPIFTNDELVYFGKTYADGKDYRIDEPAIVHLYDKIGEIQSPDHAVTIADVKDIVDRAIKKVERFGPRKLFSSLSGKRFDEEDRVILFEKDFK